ncbi:MAG TPA: TonB family protein [Thermoanaerobaculia bacterium]
MRAEVDRVLADRARRTGRRPEAVSLAAAVALHAVVALIALLLPRLQRPPEPLSFVPVQIIPAQALGVRRPAPPRRRSPPAEEKPAVEPDAPEPDPEPAAPEPEPQEPAPKPPADDVPVLPDKDAKKKPEPKPETGGRADTKKPESGSRKPAPDDTSGGPAGVASGETGDQLGRRGAATGSPLGTTAFGGRLGVDNPDFTFGYYLDRLLSLIDAQWVRPQLGDGIKATIHFQIGRDGSLSDLRVAESSGYNSFDLAALRAVQNAAPFPPLPRAYRHDSLGVNLIVY